MRYIAAEDVAKAKEMDLLTYLRNYEPQELVHVSGNTYCTREHDSLRISNGKRLGIHHTISPKLGERCRTNKSIYYTLDFHVTPHLLRHTYITNLIHEGVDPKTVQYLAGHENSKVTMDIYAKVKCNKPWELAPVINQAFSTNSEKESA